MHEDDCGKTVPDIRGLGKKPRDFVYVDEFWDADEDWPHYFLNNQLWVYVDTYDAELAGDEDHCRIIIDAGRDYRWLYKRALEEQKHVFEVLKNIQRPVAETQLEQLGFTRWCGTLS